MTLEEIYDIRFLKYQGFADKIVSNSDDITKAVSDLVKIVTDWKK